MALLSPQCPRGRITDYGESTASVNKRDGLFQRETWGLARGRLTPGILGMQNKGPPVTQCKQIMN